METSQYFTFDHPWHPFAWVGALTALLFLFWIWSRGLRQVLARKNYVTLWVIQALIFVTVLFLLCEPVLKRVVEEKTEGKLLVLFDASASTQLRKESPWKLAYQKDNPISEKSGGYEPEYFLFSEEVKRLDPKVLEIPPMSSGTKIFHAVDSVLRESEHADDRVLLLFSDGRNEVSREQMDALKLAGVPVFTVGLGESEDKSRAVKDVILEGMTAPDTALLFQTVPVKARVKVLGALAGELTLDLQSDGKNVARKRIPLREGQKNYDSELEWQPASVGETTLTLSIPKWEEEQNTGNNQIRKKVRVVSKSSRLLWVQGELSWEFAFLRKALSALTSFDLHSLVLALPSQWLANVESLRSGFPEAKALLSYGAVVFLNCPLDFFSEERLKALDTFVSERGGSLVFAGGKSFQNAKDIPPLLQKMLPIRTEESGMFFDPVEKTLHLNPDLKEREEWKSFPEKEFAESPAVSGTWKGWKAKETALSVLQETTGPEDKSPNSVVLCHSYGLGKVFFTGVESSWLWKLAKDEESKKFYDDFWKTFFSWVMGTQTDSEGDTALTLRVEDSAPVQGSAVRIQVKPGKGLVENTPEKMKESLRLSVRNPDNQVLDLPFEIPAGGANQAYASFVPGRSGEYHLEAVLEANGRRATNTLVLNVREDLREYEDLSRNESLLRRLSQETGGQYASWTEYLEKPFVFHRDEGLRKKSRMDPLWCSPWTFLFLLAFLSLGWILRRSIHLD